MGNSIRFLMVAGFLNLVCVSVLAQSALPMPDLNDKEMDLILAAEKARIDAIKKVMGSVVSIYGEIRGGGGSGVIFDPSGLALTNHHVVAGAGVSGWGGIADGKLYKWRLVGTDPGGDVAIIKLEGRQDFPYSPLGNSDEVQVGDWAIAMGNPFVLTEDQKPTVTLGIVSGIERYQPGAGGNQLVYGNCIQVDSSINPGNSGGPLFNLQGEVIGINGRGSFLARGRVNVGLGYAISANQIKNFIPDLMATKLVEHGTLDVRFGVRQGKVVCDAMYNAGVEIVNQGLELGDELLEFEGCKIKSNDQFTNLISMLPETWPANVVFRKPDGTIKDVYVRLVGLPYKKRAPRSRPVPPPRQEKGEGGKKGPTPEQKRAAERQKAMAKVMLTQAGTIRDEK
ncbi:MAG: trypsin-like peptidase domain-containing protein, partial [Planctomycetota bacterium]|nr:trypsin-like peptidase domain-containing protein [Planctomycetota bacterium]